VRLDYHLKQLSGTPQQLVFGVTQLLIALLLQLHKTGLEYFLLVVSMCQLHKHEDVVLLSFGVYVLLYQFQQELYVEKLHDGVVVHNLGTCDLDGKAVEAF
jgi:hypothetical protein